MSGGSQRRSRRPGERDSVNKKYSNNHLQIKERLDGIKTIYPSHESATKKKRVDCSNKSLANNLLTGDKD